MGLIAVVKVKQPYIILMYSSFKVKFICSVPFTYYILDYGERTNGDDLRMCIHTLNIFVYISL